MIAIVDYGVGNLFSLRASFAKIGVETTVSGDPDLLRAADGLILPGVGAFGDASEKLRASGLDRLLCEEAGRGKPLLGICLGMQLLFEESLEFGRHRGLGLLHGKVVPMRGKIPEGLKIPQIGWNSLHFVKPSPLFAGVREGDFVYFVHSFYASGCEESLLAVTDYGREITAAVGLKNVFGCQFHPEKSGEVGLSVLRAFAQLIGNPGRASAPSDYPL